MAIQNKAIYTSHIPTPRGPGVTRRQSLRFLPVLLALWLFAQPDRDLEAGHIWVGHSV